MTKQTNQRHTTKIPNTQQQTEGKKNQQREHADRQNTVYGKHHIKAKSGTAEGAHTVLHHRQWCLHRWSIQEAMISKANISNLAVASHRCKYYISYRSKYEPSLTLLRHVLTHSSTIATLGHKCTLHAIIIFLVFFFRAMSGFLDIYLGAPGLWQALWEKNDPVCLC